MKILLVTPYYYPKIGGLETYARQLGLALKQDHKLDLVIVTSNHNGRSTIVEQIDGIKVYRLGRWFKVSNTPINPLWPLMIRRILKREHPDVIHAHTPVPSLADAAVLAAGKIPVVITYHASTLHKLNAPLFNLIATAYSYYERLSLTRARRIVAVSPFVKAQLPAKLQAKTVVVPNAIWAADIATTTDKNQSNQFVFIGSLDRTHAWKGLGNILTAMTYDQALKLTVVGDGDYRAQYEQMAHDLGISGRVHFTGALTGHAKTAVLTQATALIAYPDSSNDAFPTVFLEAWAADVPVIAASIGPIPSLIEDEATGYLVPPHQPRLLAIKLQRVAADHASRRRVAANARRLVKGKYTWEIQSNAMYKLLQEVV